MLSQRRIEILERHLASRKEVPENVPEYLYTLTGDRPGKLVFLGKWKYLLGPKSHYACGSLTLACMPSLVFIKAIDLTDTNNILTRLTAPISNFTNSKGSKESNSIHCLINFCYTEMILCVRRAKWYFRAWVIRWVTECLLKGSFYCNPAMQVWSFRT